MANNAESLLELNDIDDEIKDEIEDLITDKKEPEENKKLLVYRAKSVSIFKLICHLSGKLEIFLMILATISTIFSGCSGALWNIIQGNTINKLTEIIEIDINDEEYLNKLNGIEGFINKLIINFVILGAMTFLSNFLMLFLWGFSALRQMHKLKGNYFELILSQEQEWFDENNEYQFSTKVQTQLEQIEMGLGDRFGQIILMISEILSGLAVGFINSWSLTLIICSSFPLILISVLISDYYAEKLMIKSKDINEKAGGIAEELLYNIKTVTSFCNFDFEIRRYNDLIDEMDKYDQKKLLIESIAYGLLYLASFGSIALVLIHAKSLKINKEINYSSGLPYNSGDVVTVVMCVLDVIYSISGLGPSFQLVQKACIASSDYFVLLSKKKNIKIKESNFIPSRDEFQGKIEFKNVVFVYPKDKAKKIVLNNFNLIIEPGKKIALVGESGCGKSTTINLIEKFYEVNSGQILIDDIDIKKYNTEYLRDLIGYVQQEPALFNSSIRNNIILGREAKLKKIGSINNMLYESCDEAYINKFISKNQEKYDYIVGIKGSKLSAGQKQRIAIARAILMQPKILILDEATSSLDNKAARKVQKALDNICEKDITTFVISHRLSTIKNADIIYAMKEGRIVEKGTHNELIEQQGYYYSLIKEQLSEEEIKRINERHESMSLSINMKENMSIYFDKFNESVNLTEEEMSTTIIEQKPKEKKEKKEIKINKKKIWELVSDHKCSLIIGILSGLIYGSVSPFVGVYLGKTIFSLSLNDPDKIESDIFPFIIFFIIISVVGGLSIFLKIWKLQSLGLIISLKIKKKMIKKYLELNMSYFDNNENSPGTLSTKLAIDSGQLDSLILNLIGGILTSLSTLIVSFILGILYDWKITLILFLFSPLMIYGSLKKDDYKENGRQTSKESKVEAGSFLSECVTNMKTIYSFNFQNKANIIYKEFLNRENKNFLKNSIMQGFWLGLSLSVENFAFAVVYKVGFIFLKEKMSTFKNLICTIYNIYNSCDGLSDILRNMGDSGKAKLAYKSIFEVLNTKIEFSPFLENNKLKLDTKNLEGSIEFKNVYFSYPTKPDQLILKNLSFTINPGEKVGLVGLSGSGKSTIMKLIERFYDVNSGEILIDGENIKNYNLYELRKKIGFVEQEPSIFKRNVYENILYGNLNAKKEEIISMAKKTKISKLLYDDYEKKENPLSGGQKQRVSIARAFIKDPTILLLDEATSELDIETEIEIQKNIHEMTKNKTLITVAHRLNTIINSDVIFVLDHGQLSEKGTHDELVKLKGKYYTLYKYSKR